MPGVLQLEAMAQVGGIIALQEPITDGKGDFFFAGVTDVKWRRPVVPGDNLIMEMEVRGRRDLELCAPWKSKARCLFLILLRPASRLVAADGVQAAVRAGQDEGRIVRRRAEGGRGHLPVRDGGGQEEVSVEYRP